MPCGPDLFRLVKDLSRVSVPCLPDLPDPPDLPDLRGLHVGELVADAPDRQQKSRTGGIRLDAATQALDQRVDAADRDERVAAPDLREQRFAAEHDPGVRREQMQQPEFLIGELDFPPVDAHPPTRRINLDAMDEDGRL